MRNKFIVCHQDNLPDSHLDGCFISSASEIAIRINVVAVNQMSIDLSEVKLCVARKSHHEDGK